jgi:hypothetical protein
MKWLIVPDSRLVELEAINQAHSDRKCMALQAATGQWVTPADKITDAYWAAWHEFLSALVEFEGNPEFLQQEEN